MNPGAGDALVLSREDFRGVFGDLPFGVFDELRAAPPKKPPLFFLFLSAVRLTALFDRLVFPFAGVRGAVSSCCCCCCILRFSRASTSSWFKFTFVFPLALALRIFSCADCTTASSRSLIEAR